jgi:hypothetical protein
MFLMTPNLWPCNAIALYCYSLSIAKLFVSKMRPNTLFYDFFLKSCKDFSKLCNFLFFGVIRNVIYYTIEYKVYDFLSVIFWNII